MTAGRGVAGRVCPFGRLVYPWWPVLFLFLNFHGVGDLSTHQIWGLPGQFDSGDRPVVSFIDHLCERVYESIEDAEEAFRERISDGETK